MGVGRVMLVVEWRWHCHRRSECSGGGKGSGVAVDWWWRGRWIGGGLVVARLRVLGVELWLWSSGGRTTGGGGQVPVSGGDGGC